MVEHDEHRLRAEALALRREVMEKVSALATAAFGLVAALAWNNAIQALFNRYYPAPTSGAALVPLTLYALAVTALAVFAIIGIGRLAARLRKEEDEARGKSAARP